MEDDWSNPSIGASGLGYELWCDGMEITQFTYMQKVGGIDIPANMISGEITYGLERLAMYIQNKDNYLDLDYCDGVKYGDINTQLVEKEECEYYQNYQDDTDFLKLLFKHSLENAKKLVKNGMKNIAYEQCLVASHTLNILDARHELSQVERKNWILDIREIVAMILHDNKH
jgi:glycyl-tRNA synthetase alpha chain